MPQATIWPPGHLYLIYTFTISLPCVATPAHTSIYSGDPGFRKHRAIFPCCLFILYTGELCTQSIAHPCHSCHTHKNGTAGWPLASPDDKMVVSTWCGIVIAETRADWWCFSLPTKPFLNCNCLEPFFPDLCIFYLLTRTSRVSQPVLTKYPDCKYSNTTLVGFGTLVCLEVGKSVQEGVFKLPYFTRGKGSASSSGPSGHCFSTLL